METVDGERMYSPKNVATGRRDSAEPFVRSHQFPVTHTCIYRQISQDHFRKIITAPVSPIAPEILAIPSNLLTPTQPAAPPSVAVEAKRDLTSQTVLAYFEAIRNADAGAQADHFDHLVGICYQAVQPYFLRHREGAVIVAGVPQYTDKDGRRMSSSTRREGTPLDATRTWIQGWLLEFLTPYQGKSEVDLLAAADAGKFRKLGFWCRLRLKNLVFRQQKREAKEELAGFETADENLGIRGPGAASSLSGMSFEDVLAGAANAIRIVEANAVELDRLGLLVGLRCYLANTEHVLEQHFEGRVTATIAETLDVSLRAARAYKKTYRENIQRELERRNPLVCSIINELIYDDPRPTQFQDADESNEQRANRRLLREARQLKAEYVEDCRVQGLTAVAAEAGT